MIKECLSRVSAIGGCMLLAGCATTGTVSTKEVKSMDAGKVLLTSADVRMISQVKPGNNEYPGIVNPSYITCAEPSPDVAKVVAETSNRGLSFSAQLQKGIEPEVAYAVSKAHAESMAQLGERLATISLLRDALYRACEAYANGALSSTSYAILLSRYDDTMISLHNSELASGAFGRTLAGLSGEGSGKASARLDTKSMLTEHSDSLSELTESVKQSSDIENSLKQIETRKAELKELREELQPLKSQLESNRDEAVASGSAAKQADAERRLQVQHESLTQVDSQLDQLEKTRLSLDTALKQTQKSITTTQRNLEKQFASTAESAAKSDVVTGGSIEPGKQSADVAEVLAKMQQEYLENINTDAMDVACVVAMDRKAGSLNELGTYCKEEQILKESLALKKRVLELILNMKMKEHHPGASASVDVKSAVQPARLSRETVMWIQTSLNKIESAGLEVNGIMGAETESAIKKFQSENGLKVDGIAGPATRHKLRQML